jgi:hypothetical protein
LYDGSSDQRNGVCGIYGKKTYAYLFNRTRTLKEK